MFQVIELDQLLRIDRQVEQMCVGLTSHDACNNLELYYRRLMQSLLDEARESKKAEMIEEMIVMLFHLQNLEIRKHRSGGRKPPLAKRRRRGQA